VLWDVLGAYSFFACVIYCLLEVVEVLTEVDCNIWLILLINDTSLVGISKEHISALQEIEHRTRMLRNVDFLILRVKSVMINELLG